MKTKPTDSRSSDTAREQGDLAAPRVNCTFLDEPLLVFGSDGIHVDPKAGIARHGPHSLGTSRHPNEIRVSIIGTADTTSASADWLIKSAKGVQGTDKHRDFPGFMKDRGFFGQISVDQAWNEQLTQSEISDLLRRGLRRRDRFFLTLQCFEQKLRLLSERDQPPDYVLLAIPDDLLKAVSVVEYIDQELGRVHRDLRRAFKASAMKYRLVTQILRMQTIDGRDETPASKIAWNFFTGLYSKAGGVPWTLQRPSAGTCFVGVSFYRALGDRRNTLHTSVVQAFDEHGQGLILRGPSFEWNPAREGTASPHLGAEDAKRLIDIVLERYQRETKRMPERIVVHKASQYWPAEREGFVAGLKGQVRRFDLVAMRPQNQVRLFPLNRYPALRGTMFSLGDVDFLYTTGYLAPMSEFHALHVPSPLEITDHVGQDTPRKELMEEILGLSKMNWNSSGYAGLKPVTLRFSQLVGDILKEVPETQEPLPQFKFYI